MSETFDGNNTQQWHVQYESIEDELLKHKLRLETAYVRSQDRAESQLRRSELFDASVSTFDQVFAAVALEESAAARYCLASALILANADIDSMNLPEVEKQPAQIKIPAFVKRGAKVHTADAQPWKEISSYINPPVFDTFHPYEANCKNLIKAVNVLEANLRDEPYSETQAELIKAAMTKAHEVFKGTELINKNGSLMQLLTMAHQIASYHEPGLNEACDIAAFKTYTLLLSACGRVDTSKKAPILYDTAEKLLLLIHSSPAFSANDELIERNRLGVLWALDELGRLKGVDAQKLKDKKSELLDFVLPSETFLAEGLAESA